MSETIKTKTADGREATCEARNFTMTREPWSEYILDDEGLRIRVRLIITKIFVSKDAKQPDGSPVVAIQSQAIVAADVLSEGDRPPSVTSP